MKKAKGIIFNSGPEWRELRRFTLRTLRDFGMNQKGTEKLVLEECKSIKEAIDQMVKASEGVVNVNKLFNMAALNVVWHFIAAERFDDYDDKKMKELYQIVEHSNTMFKLVVGKPLGLFPILRHIPPFRSSFNEAHKGMTKCREFLAKTIRRHEETLDANEPRDFIDQFLIHMKNNPSPCLTKEQLLFCCLDIFAAGSETTNRSMMYVVMLIHHPDKQEKVHDEIFDVTEGKDLVTLSDKESLPYTEAFLNEVWRFCNILPMPTKQTSASLKLDHYEIPAGTDVLTNIYSVHMDTR